MGKKRKRKPRILRPVFKVYQCGAGWQWELRSRNGKVYAYNATPYKTKIGCKRAVEAVQNLAPACLIEVDG